MQRLSLDKRYGRKTFEILATEGEASCNQQRFGRAVEQHILILETQKNRLSEKLKRRPTPKYRTALQKSLLNNRAVELDVEPSFIKHDQDMRHGANIRPERLENDERVRNTYSDDGG